MQDNKDKTIRLEPIKEWVDVSFPDNKAAIEDWQIALRKHIDEGRFDDKFNPKTLEFVYAFQMGFNAASPSPVQGIDAIEGIRQTTDFENELSKLINRLSIERETDTPDFILAEYLNACYRAYYWANVKKQSWHSPSSVQRMELCNNKSFITDVINKYVRHESRSVGRGCNHEEYILANDIGEIINEIIEVSPSSVQGMGRPKIVCLCGSTRFMEAFQEANLKETLAGNIVLSVGCNTKSDRDLLHSGELTEELKKNLDELHKRKIDLADEIFVLNVGGYIGSSTASEIDYAIKTKKKVRYLKYLSDEEK